MDVICVKQRTEGNLVALEKTVVLIDDDLDAFALKVIND